MTSLKASFVGCVTLVLGACAALPEDGPVVESLDPQTGITVMRFGRAMELYREAAVRDAASRFAFVGPFERNNMGERQLYLWVAVPTAQSGGGIASVEVNGTALALGEPGRGAEFAALRDSPYRIQTPWFATFYYRLGTPDLLRLRDAARITVRVTETTRDGPVEAVFVSEGGPDTRFAEFARRHAPD
jgi:hypothetical protein